VILCWVAEPELGMLQGAGGYLRGSSGSEFFPTLDTKGFAKCSES